MRHFKEVLYSTAMFTVISVSLLVAGCDEESGPPAALAQESHEHMSDVPSAAEAQDETSGAEYVHVAQSGSRFDPPVSASQIPVGAWMCDMNGVHFASLEHGDGECPICGMDLKRRTADSDAEPDDTEASDHRHEHGDH